MSIETKFNIEGETPVNPGNEVKKPNIATPEKKESVEELINELKIIETKIKKIGFLGINKDGDKEKITVLGDSFGMSHEIENFLKTEEGYKELYEQGRGEINKQLDKLYIQGNRYNGKDIDTYHEWQNQQIHKNPELLTMVEQYKKLKEKRNALKDKIPEEDFNKATIFLNF